MKWRDERASNPQHRAVADTHDLLAAANEKAAVAANFPKDAVGAVLRVSGGKSVFYTAVADAGIGYGGGAGAVPRFPQYSGFRAAGF